MIDRFKVSLIELAHISDLSNLTFPIHTSFVSWLIGTKGLKEKATEFHRDHLISPLLSQDPTFSFYLYDLTAWKVFRHRQLGKKSYSRHIRFNHPNIRIFDAAFILSQIISPQLPLSHLVKNAVCRPHLFKKSSTFAPSGISLAQVFPGMSTLFRNIADVDIAHTYSFFQYLELFCILDFVRASGTKDEIIFFLPNDEVEYYLFDHLDLDLRQVFPDGIKISFIQYPYGGKVSDRPYNGRGKTLKKALSPCNLINTHVCNIF